MPVNVSSEIIITVIIHPLVRSMKFHSNEYSHYFNYRFYSIFTCLKKNLRPLVAVKSCNKICEFPELFFMIIICKDADK